QAGLYLYVDGSDTTNWRDYMKSLLLKSLLILTVGSFVLAQSPVYATRDEAAQINSVTKIDEDAEKIEIDLDDVSVTDNAEMSIEDDTIIFELLNENGALKIEGLDLDTETRYAIHYKYEKLDGDLNSFGGHTDGLFLNNIVSVDGEETSTYDKKDSAFAKDDKEEHEVIVEFLKPRDKANSDFFIQPNRGDFDYVTVKISDLYLVEIPED